MKKKSFYETRQNKQASLKPFFQPKLAINQTNDIYEQEAEQVADSLMRKKGSQNNDAENPWQQKSGFDLSQVRIHTDGRAADPSRVARLARGRVSRWRPIVQETAQSDRD